MNKSYYAVIPAEVRYDTELQANAKLLYGEITALANEKGYCWAGNDYFSNLYNVDKTTISRWVSKLAEKEYVSVEIIYKQGSREVAERRIYINDIPHRKNAATPPQNSDQPHRKNAAKNNTELIVNDNKNILSKDNIEKSSKGLFELPKKQVSNKTLKSVIERFTNCVPVIEKLNKYIAVLKQVRGGSNISIIQFEEMLEELANLSIEEKKGQGRQINFKLMADIIDQSIKKGWNGFYSLDSNSNNRKNGFDDTVGNKKLGSLSQLSENEKKKWEGTLKNEQF